METLHLINGIVALAVAVILGVIVLRPSIHEGVIIKAGMLAMIIGLLATASHSFLDSENWRALWNASFMLRLGLLIVAAGLVLRRRRKGSWEAAMSDWGRL